MIKSALGDVLVGDASVIAGLATYEFTTGVPTPAVFNTRQIPRDSARPAIGIDQIAGDAEFGTRRSKGGTAFIDLLIYGDKTRSDRDLELLAWNVWSLIHRINLRPYLTGSGLCSPKCVTGPPEETLDEEGFFGYRLPVQVTFFELT